MFGLLKSVADLVGDVATIVVKPVEVVVDITHVVVKPIAEVVTELSESVKS